MLGRLTRYIAEPAAPTVQKKFHVANPSLPVTSSVISGNKSKSISWDDAPPGHTHATVSRPACRHPEALNLLVHVVGAFIVADMTKRPPSGRQGALRARGRCLGRAYSHHAVSRHHPPCDLREAAYSRSRASRPNLSAEARGRSAPLNPPLYRAATAAAVGRVCAVPRTPSPVRPWLSAARALCRSRWWRRARACPDRAEHGVLSFQHICVTIPFDRASEP